MTKTTYFSLSRHVMAVTVMALAYFTILTVTCIQKYSHYGYLDFDLAIHAQTTWNILRGESETSILGVPFLGNHMVLILYLIAPLYALAQSPITLLLLQVAALASAIFPVYLLAKKHLSEIWALLIPFAYIIYPPLIFLNLYEFHPVAFVVPFLLWAYYYFDAKSLGLFYLFSFLAMLCQENIPLIIAFFGVLGAIQRRKWTWSAVPFLAGLSLFAIVTLLIMPRLNDAIMFSSLYKHLGSSPPEIVFNMLKHPLTTLKFAFSPEKRAFLLSLLAPLSFTSLFCPTSLIPLIPLLAQRLLSARFTETLITFHYQSEFIPFFFAGAIFGIKRILSYSEKNARPAAIIFASMAIGSFFLTQIPQTLINSVNPLNLTDTDIAARKKVIQSLKPSDTVISTFNTLSHVSQRRSVYSLHHIYTGRYTLSTKEYPYPENIDVIIMDIHDPLTFRDFFSISGYSRLQQLFISGNWTTEEALNGFFVFRKNAAPTPFTPPCVQVEEILHALPPPPDLSHDIYLAGFQIGEPEDDGRTKIQLYWKKETEGTNDYTCLFNLLEDGKIVHSAYILPGSRVWPPQSWSKGTVMKDEHIILSQRPLTSEKIEPKVLLLPILRHHY